ncbi:MAG TPA: SH3 domain-containing protein [Propylenella sp.]
MTTIRMLAAAVAALGVAAAEVPAAASAFVDWRVAGVAADDVLMVRAFPNVHSRILVGYPEDVPLSMTGRCTGGVWLDRIGRLPAAEQRDMIRAEWCEVWLDPYADGAFRNGWVSGRYIRPA